VVGATLRFRERVGAAFLDREGNIPGRRPPGTEIEEQQR
jgi:hypothetical protein